MVSSYPPNSPGSVCQRCRSALFPNETRCRACGYEQNPSQGPMGQSAFSLPPTNPFSPPVQEGFPPQRGTAEQMQYRGLLDRYGSTPPQNTNDFSSFGQPSQPPFGQPSQPPIWGAQQPVMNGRAPTAPRFSEPSKKQGPRTGMIVGVVLLLIALVAGSGLAYLYFTKTPVSVKTATHSQLSPTPKSTPLFSDTFSNNTHAWSLQSYPGQFSVSLQNSTLALESDNNKLLWELVPGNQTYRNFQLSVDAVLSKGSQDNGYGIYIRGTLDQTGALVSYYRFELYGDGTFALFKSGATANASPTRLVDYTATPAIQKQGTVNHIAILVRGQSLQLSVNGNVLSTVTDASYASGAIALFVSNLQNAPAGAQVQFSHLAIYPA